MGKLGGSLSSIPVADLGAAAVREALARIELDPAANAARLSARTSPRKDHSASMLPSRTGATCTRAATGPVLSSLLAGASPWQP